VLPPDFIEALGSGSAAWRRRQLDAIWRQLGSERVVVRSSATAEDGAQRSFAGVFESILNVDRGGLEAGIAKVKASFTSERASAYAASGGKASMLVQRMITAEYAGVLLPFARSKGGSNSSVTVLSAVEMNALISAA
jgi:rifampicin phosphotransferase